MGIYKITNNITGKEYVGQSNNILRRIREHKKAYGSKNCYVDRSIQKYGWENFSYTILHKCDLKDLDYYERYFIKKYDTYKNGYNLTPGGKDYHLLKNKSIKKKMVHTRCIKYNNTGFYRVSKCKRDDVKVGYVYTYKYRKKGKVCLIQSANLKVLEKKVKDKNCEWKILDKDKAESTLESNINDLKKHGWRNAKNKTGFYRVSKVKDEKLVQGFTYLYQYRINGKHKAISCKTIDGLKEKVIGKGLEWKVLG